MFRQCAHAEILSELSGKSFGVQSLTLLDPIYMVSGTRDNLPPELPWPRYLLAYFPAKFNQPFTLGSRTRLGGGETTRVGELSRLGR